MKKQLFPSEKKQVRLFTLLLGLFMVAAVAANAQKDYSVILTSPAAGAEIVKGKTFNIVFTIKNNSASATINTSMDTIEVMSMIGMDEVYMGMIPGGVSIMPGMSQSFTIPNVVYNNISANSSGNLCMGALMMHNTDPTTTDQQDCKSVALKLAPTSIATQTKEAVISLYPNPANGQVTVSATTPVSAELRIFDITGKEMASVNINGATQTILTGTYPNGIYYFRLSDRQGNAIQNGKFIVAH